MVRIPPLIAVVDDDAFVRRALERLFRSAGHSVEVYPSGAEFLGCVQERRPDCVVLDLHMPEVNGFEVQLQLARVAPKLRVVIITGHDTPESRSRSLKNGAAAYLCKPVDDEMLLKAVADALAGG